MTHSPKHFSTLILVFITLILGACGSADKAKNEKGDSAPAPSAAPPKPDALTQGTILHNIPDTMRVSKKQRVEVRLIRSRDRISIVQNVKGSQKVKIADIKVGKAMGVKLIGSPKNFEILAHSSEIQAVGRREYTLWEWDVTPLKDGRHDLYLKVIVRKGDYNKDLPVFDKKVQVVTSETKKWVSFFNNNKEWIMGSLVIPLLFLIASRLGGWRRPKRKKTATRKKTTKKTTAKKKTSRGR
ncbi:MAG TPA: hypothetical protein DCS93_06665 [Microscillaceae bacterium]|nr:hypothetical protein [Microscillaceae bacterium]